VIFRASDLNRPWFRADGTIIHPLDGATMTVGPGGIECANGPPQPGPYILWCFYLTPPHHWARIRANIGPSQGNRVAPKGRPPRKANGGR